MLLTKHPGGDGCHALHVGGVWCHDVEDVDEHEEEGDEHRHPAGHHLGGDQEADPGDNDEKTRGQIVDVEILHHVTLQFHFNACKTNPILFDTFHLLWKQIMKVNSYRKMLLNC